MPCSCDENHQLNKKIVPKIPQNMFHLSIDDDSLFHVHMKCIWQENDLKFSLTFNEEEVTFPYRSKSIVF